MTEEKIKKIVECMPVSELTRPIQLIQTKHRVKLVEFWDVKVGSKILEIGCGQGDTTAVLAYYAGEEGYVHGIDIASPTYGSPVNLGDSAKYLLQSKLGKQIRIDFNVDLLSPEFELEDASFDYIVFSHCSWYTRSREELLNILSKVRKWGKQLCFAEWSTTFNSIEQFPHLLSILIQAQYEAFKRESQSNIRTLLTPEDIKEITELAGWKIIRDEMIESPDLQDGRWEVDIVLSGFDNELRDIENLPDKMKDLLRSQISILKSSIVHKDIQPLPIYCFVAQ
ncbi:class I SAM-dependent methyltransferase [Chungangia koreensis]|uniref:Class I SAM-dependent methyltransferase n=1 Tax=Chungangia koreensis TaxID=752657 RepID=A0ABV8X159_9LACT